jgi:hypothetical protein
MPKGPKKNWVAVIYCDYGNPETKRAICHSYSKESAKKAWIKYLKPFSQNGWRCWQESKRGKLLRDSREKIKNES